MLIDLIRKLQEEGFEIKFRKRSDGGYIVTSINGVKYTGASGNKRVREITGANLSEARISQTQFNVKKYIKGHKKSKMSLPEDINKMLKEVQAKMRKTNAKGKVTKRKVKEKYLEGGRREAKRYLREMDKYARGIAYEDNVMWLRDRIKSYANSCPFAKAKNQLHAIANKVWRDKDEIREEWINKINELLYKLPNVWSSEIEVNIIVNKIKDIIS